MPLLNAIAAEAIAKIAHFSHQDLSNTAWAFSKIALLHRPLLNSAVLAGPAWRAELVPQDLANTAWSFAALWLQD